MSCKLDGNGEASIAESVTSCNTDCPLVNIIIVLLLLLWFLFSLSRVFLLFNFETLFNISGMGVHAFGGQLLRDVRTKVLRDAKPNVPGQRNVDLRQLHNVHLFEIRIQRGNIEFKKKTGILRTVVQVGGNAGRLLFYLYIGKATVSDCGQETIPSEWRRQRPKKKKKMISDISSIFTNPETRVPKSIVFFFFSQNCLRIIK